MSTASAVAHANIALVKYWGKRNAELNLPARGSLSLTLEALSTTTTVSFEGDGDRVEIDGATAIGVARDRVSRFLDLIRDEAGIDSPARVVSSSNFPAASGLASSASAFAALAVAGARAAGLDLSQRALSALARRGSGSAARSIFGGFVRMYDGDDHGEAYAEPVASNWGAENGELRMVIAIAEGGPKKHPSRDAMEHCARTSPLHAGWLATVNDDLKYAEDAIARRHLGDLGAVMERSALTMHASMWAARPAIRYFRPVTLELMDAVVSLREGGIQAFYTMDAGPHVKVLTLADHAAEVESALAAVDGVREVLVSRPGPGVHEG